MKTRNISFKIISIVTLLSLRIVTMAQSLSPFVVASAGSSGNNGNISLEWTVGETCITTLNGANTILTQGFHQPDFKQLQIIDLNAGWSGISSYLVPVNVSAFTIFSQLSNNLIIVKNHSGFYWPSQNINTLGLWYEKETFEIKVNESSVLQVSGKPLNDHSLLLEQGWNYLPVLRNCPIPVEDLTNGHPGIEIIKGIATSGVFWPQFGINTIVNLEPGKGYFIKCASDLVVNFPQCDGYKSAETALDFFDHENSPWPVVKPSPVSHLIVFAEEAANELSAEDIIGVFANGQCVGITQLSAQDFDNKNAFSVTAFADDPATAETDGFVEGGAIEIRIFNPESEKQAVANLSWDSSLPDYNGVFRLNGISAVKSLEINTTNSIRFISQIKVFPNPTTGIFRITGIENLVKISVLNANGMQLKSFSKSLADGSLEFDISELPTGIYWITIETNDFTKTEKIVKY